MQPIKNFWPSGPTEFLSFTRTQWALWWAEQNPGMWAAESSDRTTGVGFSETEWIIIEMAAIQIMVPIRIKVCVSKITAAASQMVDGTSEVDWPGWASQSDSAVSFASHLIHVSFYPHETTGLLRSVSMLLTVDDQQPPLLIFSADWLFL